MEIGLDVQDYEKQIRLHQLEKTMEYANIRCLSSVELINNISGLDQGDDPAGYIARLLELELNESELSLLGKAMTELARRSVEAPSTLKRKLDRVLLRLVRMLPSELATYFAAPYLDHRSKDRRFWAYAALRKKLIPKGMGEKLVDAFRRTGDQEALELIARNAARVTETDPEFLLANIDDKYWRGRVIEALLIHQRPAALALASRYPFEFAHAAGRVGDRALRRTLRELLRENCDDPDFLSIYAYALGKIGAKRELQILKKFVSRTWGPCAINQKL